MMIRSTGHHSSERRYKKERFRNQNFRKYHLIEDDNSDYENGISRGLPDKRRKDVQTKVLRTTHTSPFDSNAFENIKNKSYSTKKTENAADAHFQWISDRFENKTRGVDEVDDVPIRIYPAYNKRDNHEKRENVTKHSQATKSYSTKVYRSNTRKTREPDYERLMQPLTIATTGWTTSTSTTLAAKANEHSKKSVPAIVTTSYGEGRNKITKPLHGYKSLATDTRGFNRNVTTTPTHGYDNTRNVNVSKECGQNASTSSYSTTKIVYNESRGTSVSSPPSYGSIRHRNATPVVGYDNTRNTTASVTSNNVARSDPSRQQRKQIIQKRDSGEYDNFDENVVSQGTSRRQTQEYRHIVDSHEEAKRNAGSNAVRKTKQKSQTLQVPREYVIQRRETSRERSSERLYKTESSDDSDQDDFKLKLVGTQYVDEKETGQRKKAGPMPTYQNQERRNVQSSKSYRTQHVRSQMSQYHNSLAVAKTKQKNQRLQVPSPYVAGTHNVTEKSNILQLPSEYTTRKSVSSEKLYITESPEDSEQDDFNLQLVGTKQLNGQVGARGLHSSQTCTGHNVKNIQNRRTYSSVVKNQQTAHSVQVPNFQTQQYSSIKQGEIRIPPEKQNLTHRHGQQHQQRQMTSKSQTSFTDFVLHMQNTQPRSNQMTEQLSRAEESTKSVKGRNIESQMKENLVAFEESNRYLRQVVQQAEERLQDLEEVQKEPKFRQLVPPGLGEKDQREQAIQQIIEKEHPNQVQAKTQSSNQISSSYQKQYSYQMSNTRQGHSVTPSSQIQPERPNTLDSTKVSTYQNKALSSGQVSAAPTYGYTQQTMSTTQMYDKKQYQKAQSLNRADTEVDKKLQEMEKNELNRGGFRSHSTPKKSLLTKQGSDEYDNVTIEDLINRDNEIRSQKVDDTNINCKSETSVGDQIFGQNLNGVKHHEGHEKWLYKQEYYGSRETVGMNKDLKHDSAYYSYTTLNQDGHGYLNNETKDTKNGYKSNNDGSESNSSSSNLCSSAKQSSTYASRSSYGQSGSVVDEGGLLYKTFKQKDNGYKRVKDNDIVLDKNGSMSDSSRRAPPAYTYRSEDGYETSSERSRYGDSVHRDIYSDTETLKKKPTDDKGGLFFKAVKKSSSVKEKNVMRNTFVKRSNRYDDDDSSSTIQSESSYKSGKEFNNSKHQDYYSRRSNLGMCCVQVKCSILYFHLCQKNVFLSVFDYRVVSLSVQDHFTMG